MKLSAWQEPVGPGVASDQEVGRPGCTGSFQDPRNLGQASERWPGLGEKKRLTAERTRRSALLSRVSARNSLERRFSSFLQSVTTSRLRVELHVCIRSSSRRASLDNATSRGSAFSCGNWVTAPALGSYCEDYTSNSTYVANASKAAMDAPGRGLSDGAQRSHEVQNLHSHRRQLGQTHSKRATTAPAVLVRRQTPAMRVEQTRSRRGKVATARGVGGEPKVSGAQPSCGPGAEGRNPGLPGGAAEPSTRTGQERVRLALGPASRVPAAHGPPGEVGRGLLPRELSSPDRQGFRRTGKLRCIGPRREPDTEGDPSEPRVTRLTGHLARMYREPPPSGAPRAQHWHVTKATCSRRVGASPGDPPSRAVPGRLSLHSSDSDKLSHSHDEFTMRVREREMKSRKIYRDQLTDGFSYLWIKENASPINLQW